MIYVVSTLCWGNSTLLLYNMCPFCEKTVYKISSKCEKKFTIYIKYDGVYDSPFFIIQKMGH